jgi:hypothetical protein
MPSFSRTRGPDETTWVVEHAGKAYARDQYDNILVWQCASRRTGRWHWVAARSPPAEVVAALQPAKARTPVD